jgi:hypothetical protein
MGIERQEATSFVDGGAVFLARPYTEAEWTPVRTAWWWHTVGMVFFPAAYPLLALTVWQRPSRQSLGRRIVWASLLTVSAWFVVGIPPLIVFSRRWYYLYRTRTDPAVAGLPSGSAAGPTTWYEWVAAKGRALVDRITGWFATDPRASLPPPPQPRPAFVPVPPARWYGPAPQRGHQGPVFDEPWSSLVAEAYRSVERIRWASSRAQGPSAARIAGAFREASVAAQWAWQVAARARDIEAALRSTNLPAMEQHLTTLEASDCDPSDIEAVRRSLTVQREAAGRMRTSSKRLLGQLERLVAQLGEAAVCAEELALGVLPPGDQAPGLTNAIDSIAAMRAALDIVEMPTGDLR